MKSVFFILFFYKPKTTPKNSLLRKKNGMEQASLHWDLLKHIFFFFHTSPFQGLTLEGEQRLCGYLLSFPPSPET